MRGFFSGSTLAASKNPHALLPECGACGLLKTCRTPKMPVYGHGRLGLLLVLPAPDGADDAATKPLSGQTGHYLRNAFALHGIDIERDCWVTHAASCAPPGGKAVSYKEVDHCRPLLRETIKQLDPVGIIPVGIAAVRGVVFDVWKEELGQTTIETWVGFNAPSQALNSWISPIWEPGYVQAASSGHKANPTVSLWWHRHIQQAIDCIKKGRPWPVKPDWDKKVERITNLDEAAYKIRKLASLTTGMSAFDYENNCLKPDPDYARAASASIAWGRNEVEFCIAYPWQGAAIEATREYVLSPQPKIASNLKHEERWTYKLFDTPLRNWWLDTMIMAHVLDPREGITGLKFQSFALLGRPSYDDHLKPFLQSKGEEKCNRIFKEISLDDLLLYNGLDSLLEWYVARDQALLLGRPLPEGVGGCGPCLR